jgi:hypothetical protein
MCQPEEGGMGLGGDGAAHLSKAATGDGPAFHEGTKKMKTIFSLSSTSGRDEKIIRPRAYTHTHAIVKHTP